MQLTQDLIQAQAERTERARSTLLAGKFLVTRTSPQQWKVKNDDKLPYVVSLKPSQSDFVGNDWTCTCMDFRQRGSIIHCKHNESKCLFEAAQNQIPKVIVKENQMNNSTPASEGGFDDRLSCIPKGDNILWELRTWLTGNAAQSRRHPLTRKPTLI